MSFSIETEEIDLTASFRSPRWFLIRRESPKEAREAIIVLLVGVFRFFLSFSKHDRQGCVIVNVALSSPLTIFISSRLSNQTIHFLLLCPGSSVISPFQLHKWARLLLDSWNSRLKQMTAVANQNYSFTPIPSYRMEQLKEITAESEFLLLSEEFYWIYRRNPGGKCCATMKTWNVLNTVSDLLNYPLLFSDHVARYSLIDKLRKELSIGLEGKPVDAVQMLVGPESENHYLAVWTKEMHLAAPANHSIPCHTYHGTVTSNLRIKNLG